MRLLLITAVLVFAMPITGFGWAEGSNLLLDPHLICKKPKRLRGKLYEICKNETSLWKEISNGIQLGFQECQHQFKNRRWNCTTQKKYMRKILVKDTRETGFVNAITAAGITYAVTRACTKGDLFECSCDKNHRRHHISQQHNNKMYSTNNNNNNYKNSNYNNRNINENNSDNNSNNNNNNNNVNDNNIISNHYNSNRNNNNNYRVNRNRNNHMKKHRIKQHNKMKTNKKLGKNIVPPPGDNWEWGGCDDNINFGYRKSKDFLDARYKRRSDIKTLVKLHNNDAGRLAVKNNMGVVCKCHGLTGSCTIKTCWIKMAEFREIGQRLKERFDGASKVIARNDGYSFMPDGPTLKHPTKHDLVYTEDSPDFCKLNYKTGALGTYGRECNATSQGVDGCDLLCCSRGYDNKVVRERVNCHCVLKINFKVACSTCIEKREVNTCK